MLRQLLLFLAMLSSIVACADSAPKISDNITITLHGQHRPFSHVDSICAIVFNLWGTDTATLHYSTEKYHTGATIDKEGNNYVIHSYHEIRSFKVIVFIRGKKSESEVLQRFPGNKVFWLEKEQESLKDWSPFFHELWYKYFISLLITLFCEVLIGFSFYSNRKGDKTFLAYFKSFSMINLITHFSLWYIYSSTYVPLLFLEVLVVIIESLYWTFYFKFSITRALLISLLTNLTSLIFGAIVSFFM